MALAGADGDRAHAYGGGGVRLAAASRPRAAQGSAELRSCIERRRRVGRRICAIAAERRGAAFEEAAKDGLRNDEGVLEKKGTSKGKGYGQPMDSHVRVQESQGNDGSQVSAGGPPEQGPGGTGDWICGLTWEHTPPDEENYIAANGDKGTWILVDSGAACHVCPRDWMSQADTCVQAGRDLKTVSGESLQHYGRRTVRMKFDGSEGHVEGQGLRPAEGPVRECTGVPE